MSRIATIGAVLFLANVGAAAAAPSRATLTIRGEVPVECHAELRGSHTSADKGIVRLGLLDEFCNAPLIYRLIAFYPPTDDPGMLLIDGTTVPLNSSGQTVVAVERGPQIKSRLLFYRPGRAPLPSLHIALDATR